MSGAENIAKLSGRSFAMLFGVISPKMSTTTVMTAVDTVAPLSPSIWTNKTVAMELAEMLTMLLPMRIVERSRSYFSASVRASAALLLPSSAIDLSRVLEHVENAVSVAEKYADIAIKNTRMNMDISFWLRDTVTYTQKGTPVPVRLQMYLYCMYPIPVSGNTVPGIVTVHDRKCVSLSLWTAQNGPIAL